MIESIVTIYLITSVVFSILFLLKIRYDKQFDEKISQMSDGKVTFSWIDKITVPLVSGFLWPYVLYRSFSK